MSADPAVPAELLLLAGLFAGDNPQLVAENSDDLVGCAKNLVAAATLWGPGHTFDGPAAELISRPPSWAPPDVEVVEELAPALRISWMAATEARVNQGLKVLRVTVEKITDAHSIANWDPIGDIQVVPSVATSPPRLTWRFPLRLATTGGAANWRAKLASAHRATGLVDAPIDSYPQNQGPIDILIMDVAAAERVKYQQPRFEVSCVIVVGLDDSGRLLDIAGSFGTALAAGVGAPDIDWFPEFVALLGDDQPFDVALTLACAQYRHAGAVVETRIASPPGLTNITGLGHWAAYLASSVNHVGLAQLISATSFGSDGAAAVVLERIRRDIGRNTPLTIANPYAVALETLNLEDSLDGPGVVKVDAPDDPPAETTRQLLAQIIGDGQVCEAVLKPNTKHILAVRVGSPKTGKPGIPFPENKIAAEDCKRGFAVLVVDVSTDDETFHATEQLVLPTDRNLSSTIAAFPFETAASEGSVLQLRITVLYRGRPIQAARLLASIREVPLPDDRLVLLAIPLSAEPEPTPITCADVSLEDDGLTLARLGTVRRNSVPLNGAEKWASSFEELASQTLGDDHAPVSIDDPVAVELLVRLARKGRLLADKLAELGCREARTISVLVRYDAPVLPLELAYDGVMPKRGAKLCDCRGKVPAKPGRGCSKSSPNRVCPSAFWGMNRVIARTIRGREVESLPSRPRLKPLTLRPVLFAAAKRADNGSPRESRPSDQLEVALKQHAGVDRCTRVQSWRAWEGAVQSMHPQLLVVLGHTDQAETEVTIEIGSRSVLAQADISERVLGSLNAPKPVVLLFACDSAIAGDAFGPLPSTFIDNGAAAVVATLTKFNGKHAAAAAGAVVSAMHSRTGLPGRTLGTALTQARRDLVAMGLLVGLLLVAHGEIDVELAP